jgi:hypothetical protein
MSKNIYDAYLYKYKKFIMIISYTSGINIDFLIDDISKTFNLKKIKLSEDNNNYDELNIKIEKYLEENQFNINNSLNHHYGIGLIVYGYTFPVDKLTFKSDLQLHISCPLKMFLNFDKKNTKEIYDNLTNTLVNNKINKYYNIKHPINIELNNKIFDKIIDFIMSKVYDKKDYLLYSKKSNPDKAEIINNDIDTLEFNNSSDITDIDDINDEQSSDIDNYTNIYNSKLSTLYTNLLNLNNISNKEINELLRYI